MHQTNRCKFHYVGQLFFGLLLSLVFLSDFAFGAQMVERRDRTEINWSTQKIRFYGESGVRENALKGVEGAEKRAWADGLTYIENTIHDLSVADFEGLSSNTEKISAEARIAAKNVTKSVYSLNTIFFGNGAVRVYLESSLPKALATSMIRFRQKEAASAQLLQRTGLVLKLNGRTQPRPRYRVVDEAGMPLFEARDMAEDAFGRNLMGRWFEAPADAESAEFVGKSPITIDASVNHDGSIVVPREVWTTNLDGHQSLLVNGLIAIVVPPVQTNN
jgi:hypothetical protein